MQLCRLNHAEKRVVASRTLTCAYFCAYYYGVFEWDPVKDVIKFNKKPTIFDRITKRTGMTNEQLTDEMRKRAALLNAMVKKNIATFEEFNKVVNDYYKDPAAVLKQFGVK